MFKPEPNSQSEPKRIHNKAQARESASDKVATSFTLPFDWLSGHVSFETITELLILKRNQSDHGGPVGYGKPCLTLAMLPFFKMESLVSLFTVSQRL